MNTLDTGWILVVGLALFVAWLGWTVLRSRRGRQKTQASSEVPAAAKDTAAAGASALPPAPVQAPVPPATSVAPTTSVAATTSVPPPAPPIAAPAPAPPADAIAAPVPAPVPAAAPSPRAMEAIPPTRSRPPPPRIERVLAVHRPSGEDEGDGASIPLSPPLAEALAALAATPVQPPDDQVPRRFAIALPAAAALAVARADQAQVRSLAAAQECPPSRPVQWLDSTAAAELAAVVLAVEAADTLRDVAGEMQQLKAMHAALPAKPVGVADARLKALLQESGRYARDARDNYAGLVGRTSFRERVDEAAARASTAWDELKEPDDRRRSQLETLSSTPRFGEVQVERARALLHEHRDAQRVQAIVVRAVAAMAWLRLLLGQRAADERDVLGGIEATLRQAVEHDAVLRTRLQSAEAGARGDPYVGRGEFEANRAALRKLLDELGGDLPAALERVALARSAVDRGFPAPAAAGEGWLCVLRAVDGSAGELRLRPLAPAEARAAH
ncbi:MAG TPA: hypothetical protein VHM00_02600 [Caldimonas sp.]|jgi:hypothetical protein|nr:hypothetical protein [Caldimonas sp.]HEX2539952.1 hypothetical protein [Caldimonas sp.]